MSIQIGPYRLSSPVMLAPMSGVTDSPFRTIVAEFGVGLAFSEMIASQEAVRETRQAAQKTSRISADMPHAVQLAGYDPDVLAEAAKLCCDQGAEIIDLNFGCPAKKVVNKLCGSALMRDEKHAGKILESVVAAVDVPVTMKMRTGWDADNRNAPAIAKIAENSGIQMITVHGRTREQKYKGTADWVFIRQVKEAVDIPVVANGDIVSVTDVKTCLSESGADGVMIGRGAYGRPWFPAQAAAAVMAGDEVAPPSLLRQRDTVLRHYGLILAHHGIARGVRQARKHICWYSNGLPGSAQFRATVNQIDCPETVQSFIRDFYNRAIGAPHQREAA